jgi:hypothetical protein
VDGANNGDSPLKEMFFNFYDERLLGTAWARQPYPEVAAEFFRLLALCHTVIPDGGCRHARRGVSGVCVGGGGRTAGPGEGIRVLRARPGLGRRRRGQ